ncbi:MAG: hypothetical protein ACK4K2_08955, partial [Dehalococcoidia bacterium]
MKAIVLVDKARKVTLRNLTVNGEDAAGTLGDCPRQGLFGLFYRGASGTVEKARVTNILKPGAGTGCQQNHLAIFVQSGKEGGLSAPGPYLKASAIIKSSTVDSYAKNGITCNEAGTYCLIEGNRVTGLGNTGQIGQNGIQRASGHTAPWWATPSPTTITPRTRPSPVASSSSGR